jgi:hypothetical protein
MKTLVLVMVLAMATSAFCQSAPDTLWTRAYGSIGNDIAYAVQQTSDGGYILAGDGYFNLIKTDDNGDTLWTKHIGDGWRSVQQTTEGGYIMAGCSADFPRLLKTDEYGDTLWSYIYTDLPGGLARCVRQTSDGCYILTGGTIALGIPDDFFLMKADTFGVPIWNRIYGTPARNEEAFSAQATNDGGYIVAGCSSDDNDVCAFYMVKTDSLGMPIWDRLYSVGHQDHANSVQQTTDGGFIVAGWATEIMENMNVCLLKTDEDGDLVWMRTYGGTGTETAWSVKQTPDGGYITAGARYSANPGNFYLIRTDQLGDTLWTALYGGPLGDGAYAIDLTTDGGYIIAGTTTSYGAGGNDFYLVKTQMEEGIRVTAPNGNESWHILQYDTVRWETRGVESGIRIELNRNYPLGTWEVLVDSTEDDGEAAVFVTEPPSERCRVRVSTFLDTLKDVSDANFSIIFSQGYLALVTLDQSEIPLLNLNFIAECPQDSTQILHIKNFGNESIVIFEPEALAGPEFSSTNTCPGYFALAPGEVSACSLVVTYDPLEDGVHHDTLLIMSDAVNSVGAYVRIPLQGEQISTPQVPAVVITIEDNDARLTWEPITESILGCPVDVNGYLIFYSSSYEGPYYFLNFTSDTTFVHTWVARFASSMFYEAIAYTGSVSRLDRIRSDMTKEEVMGELGITN